MKHGDFEYFEQAHSFFLQNRRVLTNYIKIAMKSQLIYMRDFEVATSARQKLH